MASHIDKITEEKIKAAAKIEEVISDFKIGRAHV